jgi:protein-S-isoprenylcysteine O-methyltransferase Ste14
MKLRGLVGAGDRIGLFVLPFAVVGLILNVAFPDVFEVGGPPAWLWTVSAVALALGVVGWVWSVWLILTRVPRGELITAGPFAVMRHPLYVSVSLLVLPWLGFLLNSWLGAFLGVVMYVAVRRYAPREEAELATRFDGAWDDYRAGVLLPGI